MNIVIEKVFELFKKRLKFASQKKGTCFNIKASLRPKILRKVEGTGLEAAENELKKPSKKALLFR